MEYLDILDENGATTGEKKEKSAVHRDGDLHRSVHVWLMNDMGELLVQKRAAGKAFFPGAWDSSVGGHVDAGESPLTTAVREVKEELGIAIPSGQFIHLFAARRDLSDGGHRENEINDIYLLKMGIGEKDITARWKEVAAVRFMSLPELESAISSGSIKFIPHLEMYSRLFKAIEPYL